MTQFLDYSYDFLQVTGFYIQVYFGFALDPPQVGIQAGNGLTGVLLAKPASGIQPIQVNGSTQKDKAPTIGSAAQRHIVYQVVHPIPAPVHINFYVVHPEFNGLGCCCESILQGQMISSLDGLLLQWDSPPAVELPPGG